jgi:hypothetical protein
MFRSENTCHATVRFNAEIDDTTGWLSRKHVNSIELSGGCKQVEEALKLLESNTVVTHFQAINSASKYNTVIDFPVNINHAIMAIKGVEASNLLVQKGRF